jgi:hypothetical protein
MAINKALYQEIREKCKAFTLEHIQKGWCPSKIRIYLCKEYEGLVTKHLIVQWIDGAMRTHAYTDEKLRKSKPRHRAYAIGVLQGIISECLAKGDMKNALIAVKDLTLLTGIHPSVEKTAPESKTTVNILNQGMQTQKIEHMTDDELRKIALQNEIPTVLISTEVDEVVEELNGS